MSEPQCQAGQSTAVLCGRHPFWRPPSAVNGGESSFVLCKGCLCHLLAFCSKKGLSSMESFYDLYDDLHDNEYDSDDIQSTSAITDTKNSSQFHDIVRVALGPLHEQSLRAHEIQWIAVIQPVFFSTLESMFASLKAYRIISQRSTEDIDDSQDVSQYQWRMNISLQMARELYVHIVFEQFVKQPQLLIRSGSISARSVFNFVRRADSWMRAFDTKGMSSRPNERPSGDDNRHRLGLSEGEFKVMFLESSPRKDMKTIMWKMLWEPVFFTNNLDQRRSSRQSRTPSHRHADRNGSPRFTNGPQTAEVTTEGDEQVTANRPVNSERATEWINAVKGMCDNINRFALLDRRTYLLQAKSLDRRGDVMRQRRQQQQFLGEKGVLMEMMTDSSQNAQDWNMELHLLLERHKEDRVEE